MKPNVSNKVLIGLIGAYLLCIIFFGLRPKYFIFTNDVRWLEDSDGIRVGKYGIVLNEGLDGIPGMNLDGGFSIAFAARALSDMEGRFKTFLMLHSGSDWKQLMVSQWKSSMIVMNGDDYDNKKRTKKLVFKDVLLPGEMHFFVVTASRRNGAALYIDGQMGKQQADVDLKIPNNHSRLQLVVGNSIYGNQGWLGDVFGLTIYGSILSEEAISNLYGRWKETRHFEMDPNFNPLISYSFDERSGNRVNDKGGTNQFLMIPTGMTAPVRQFFTLPWEHFRLNKSSLVDISINSLGFAPFGMLLFVWLKKARRQSDLVYGLLVIGICFLLSLMIETGQAWMPSRDSSLLDLILNTLGGALGVLVGNRILLGIALGTGGRP